VFLHSRALICVFIYVYMSDIVEERETEKDREFGRTSFRNTKTVRVINREKNTVEKIGRNRERSKCC
jgi:hypothetical protein